MSFPTVTFDGGRVVAFQERHLTERYVSWLNDPEVVKYSEQRHKRHTLASCRAYFESFAGSSNCFLAIELDAPELGHVGNMGVAVDTANRVADLSILLGDRRAWGTGVASRAWSGVLAELLGGQGMRKVTGGTMAANEPMLKLMARSGMQIEGERKRQFLLQGREVDLVMAAAFAPRR